MKVLCRGAVARQARVGAHWPTQQRVPAAGAISLGRRVGTCQRLMANSVEKQGRKGGALSSKRWKSSAAAASPVVSPVASLPSQLERVLSGAAGEEVGVGGRARRSRDAPGAKVAVEREDREERRHRSLRRNASITPYSPSDIISKKRDGETLTADELHWFVNGFHSGIVENYQMSAFLMAVCCRGMSNAEATMLTKAMISTGRTADLSRIRPDWPKVDKHSTGGVGNKVSLILAPLVACFDVVVPMMAGRSLGHTGGTLDKLDSIPGVRTDLTTCEFLEQLANVGCSIVSPTEDFAPVDSTMYAVRDVSGSVESIALVAASVMSKKMAANPDSLLLDVKMGRGAFFRNLNDCASLAKMMISIATDAGIDAVCLLTNMNQPLGGAVGNWLEVREAVQVLSGDSPEVRQAAASKSGFFELGTSEAALADTRELTLAQAAIMLGLAGKAESFSEGYNMAAEMLASGAALAKFADLVSAQRGDPTALLDPAVCPISKKRMTFLAPEDVIVQDIDAFEVGMAALRLGSGRKFGGDPLDYHAGILLHCKVGEVVKQGEPILTALVGDESQTRDALYALGDPHKRLLEGFQRVCSAVTIAKNAPENYVKAPPAIEYLVDRHGLTPFNSLRTERTDY